MYTYKYIHVSAKLSLCIRDILADALAVRRAIHGPLQNQHSAFSVAEFPRLPQVHVSASATGLLSLGVYAVIAVLSFPRIGGLGT